jgi:hypothetical protein
MYKKILNGLNTWSPSREVCERFLKKKKTFGAHLTTKNNTCPQSFFKKIKHIKGLLKHNEYA